MVSRVFYEAARDLDSRPSPRTDRVEACRPRGCFPVQSSGAGAREELRGGARREKNDAAPGRFEDPSTGPEGLASKVARPHTSWPRSLRLGSASRFNLARGAARRKAVLGASPHLARKAFLGCA
jgi:hypothetical protein